MAPKFYDVQIFKVNYWIAEWVFQVTDDIVHKLHQLGFTRPPTLKPMLTVSKYAI